MYLKPHEVFYAMFLRKAFKQTLSMLPNTLNQIGCHT